MACGVPVVASRTGGLPEVVVDGECGALLPVGDVSAMAARAVELLEPNRWQAVREAAVKRAQIFAEARIVPQYEALYRRVLDS
jgi:glycosyltransferase involved in cell wall biosynthesis